jgi:DNA-binding NtrC family response regulator
LPDHVRQGQGRAEHADLLGGHAARRGGAPLDPRDLRHAKGDKSVAAQLLGISTRTIYRKLGELE